MADHIKINEENSNGSRMNIENTLNIQGLILNEEEASGRKDSVSVSSAARIPETTTYDSSRSRKPERQENRSERRPDRQERRPDRSERRERERPPARKVIEEDTHQDSFDDLDEDDRKMMEELANPDKKKQDVPDDLFKTSRDSEHSKDGDDDFPPDFVRDKDVRRDRDRERNRERDSPRERGSGSGSSSKRHSSSSRKTDFSRHDFEDDAKWGYNEPDMSPEEELKRKQEILEGFDKIARKGVRIHRVFDINSDLREMEAEYNRLIKQREIENSIKFQRKMLMAFVTGVEFLNNRYNPFDLDLDGWSEIVMSDVDNYDDIFEELYEKYHTKVNMAPELRLMFTLGGSAVMFHLTNTMFKSALPGMDPGMAKGMQKMAMGAMRGGLGGGAPQGNAAASAGGFPGFGGVSAANAPVARNMPMPPRRPQSQVPPPQPPSFRRGSVAQPGVSTRPRIQSPKRREMRGPKNNDLDDILNDLNLPDNDGVGTDIEALLNSDDSAEETKHISLKQSSKRRNSIKLNGRGSD